MMTSCLVVLGWLALSVLIVGAVGFLLELRSLSQGAPTARGGDTDTIPPYCDCIAHGLRKE